MEVWWLFKLNAFALTFNPGSSVNIKIILWFYIAMLIYIRLKKNQRTDFSEIHRSLLTCTVIKEADEWRSGTILVFSSPSLYYIYALEINPDLPGSI